MEQERINNIADMRSKVKDILEVVFEEVCGEHCCTLRNISNEWHRWAGISLMSEDGWRKAPSDMRLMMDYFFKRGFHDHGFEVFFKDLYKDINNVVGVILRKVEFQILDAIDGKSVTASNWNEVINMVALSLQEMQYNIEKDIQLNGRQYNAYEEQLYKLEKEISALTPLNGLLFQSKKENLINQYIDRLIEVGISRTYNIALKYIQSLTKETKSGLCSLNDIQFTSIFAPAEIKQKSHMLVQVYLHLFEETEMVKALALESQKDVERRDFIRLQCKLKKGDKVDVQLIIYGETLLMSDHKSIVWQGSFTKCSFDYFVPKDTDIDELSCVALLAVNGVPIGEMRFITKIVDTPRQLNPEIIAHQYSKVFISYSHLDESKVKFLHEGLELGAVPHFFDRKYLKAGDVFPHVIKDYINSADLFILCWSENASKSEYVQKERLQALERAFPQVQPEKDAKLRIYPMSIEPRTELPRDMKDKYHFGEI